MTDAFPLSWPPGWPRTDRADQKRGDLAFKRQQDPGRGYRSGAPWTFAAARDALIEEVWRHTGGKSFVFSSNFEASKGVPREGRRRPEDEAVAIYFQRNGAPYVMACDRYVDAEGNMRSLTLALEALRQLERHGGGVMLERAFEGFAALPAPDWTPPARAQRPWWEVFGVMRAQADAETIGALYRVKAKAVAGDLTALLELNLARDAALLELNGGRS